MSNKPIYKYEDYIDVDKILIDQEDYYRYSLFIPFKNPINHKKVLVIMRNPSKANESDSDKTINNVLNFCHGKYGGVYIANLYPYYETNSTKIKDFIELDEYEEKMEINCQAIEDLYENTDDIIIAWGTNNTGTKYNNDYENIIKSLLDKLYEAKKNIYAVRFVSSVKPWHPRNWGKNFDLELYEWNVQ